MTRAQLFRRWRRWAFVLGIFALGIPVSTALLVRSSTSRSRLHDLASTLIQNELGLDATIGSVQLQLVPFSLVARDITLDDPVYGRFAEADELRIRPSFRALLRGAVDLHSIEIRGANLRLILRDGQIRNLPHAEGPPGGPSNGPQLPFGELRVVDSTLTVDAEPHASGQLRDVDLHLSEDDGVIQIEVTSGRGWARHRGGRERLRHIEGLVEIARDEVRVMRLELETPELEVSARDGRIPIPFREHGYHGEVDIAYNLRHLARLPLPEGTTLPPIGGRIEVHARFTSRGRDQRATGTIELSNAMIEQFGIGEHLLLRFSANRNQVRILSGSEMTNGEGGGLVGVLATLTLDPERGFPLEATARVDDFSFARLMRMLGVTENAIVEWIFDGTLRLRGTLHPLALEGPVDLDTRDFRVFGAPYHQPNARRIVAIDRGQFTARWSVREDAVRFENIVGVLPNTRLTGNVHLGYDNQLRVRARAEANLADMGHLAEWTIAGVGDARVNIDHTFQDPEVTGHVRFDDFVFDDWRLGNIESDAILDPDGLGVRFAMVHAVKGESRYRAEDLYLDFHQNRFAMTGLLHLDGLLLADFYHVFGLEEDERFSDYQGLTTGQANVRYTNGYPGDAASGTLDLDMNIALPWANLNDYAFTDGELVGHYRWLDWDRGINGAELQIAHASLSKGDGTLTIDGRMDLGGALRLNAVADRIALSELEGVGDRFPGLDGVATAIGTVGGTVDVMQADFDVGVTNITYDGRSLGDGRFFVRHTDRDHEWVAAARDWDPASIPAETCSHARYGLAHANWPADPPLRTVDGPRPRLERPMAFLVCGNALDGRLLVDLAVGRTEPLPVRGRLALAGLDLSPFLPRGEDGDLFGGSVTGTIDLAGGAIKAPETLRASVTLTEARFARNDLEIWNTRDVELDLKNGRLAIHRARFAGPDTRIRLRGYASLDEGLALSLDASLSLGLVPRLTDAVSEARGNVDAHVSITGPFADPELYGSATVAGGAFRFASFDAPVENLGGRIEFSQRSVIFDGFTADVADGRIRASGQAELREQGIERYSFDVGADHIRYAFGEGIDTELGLRARLTWERGERLPALRGELAVDRFDYARSIELRSLGDVAAGFVRGSFRRSRAEVRRYDPDAEMVQLDLRVTHDEPFRVHNELVDAQLSIENTEQPFRIVGTDERYGVLGSMEITRGSLFFQGNEFVVRRGLLRFDDPTSIDPHVDVEAFTDIRRSSNFFSGTNWRIFLNVIGPSDNLRLTTRSEPDLPEDDILTLLALGMTRSELQQAQMGDLVGTALIEAAGSLVEDEIGGALPVEASVTSAYSERTGRSEPRVAISRRLADRVRVTGSAGLGEAREFRGGLDVQLDDNTRAGISYDNYTGNASSFGNLGLDVGFRLEFE